jgi:hypothetical protein
VRIDRDAAAIVGDGQEAVGGKFDIDEGGVAGHRLVHRIVDDLGEEMVQRLLVGAADIHARPPAHRLQPFEHLDMAGVVALAAVLGRRAAFAGSLDDRIGRARCCKRCRRWLVQIGEKVVSVVHAVLKFQGGRIAVHTATIWPFDDSSSRSVRWEPEAVH